MGSLTEFFGTNMVLVFFVYGLAWFAVGLAIALESRKSIGLDFTKSLRYLAAFGLLHALVEWSDMLLLIPPDISALSGSAFLQGFKVFLLGVSTAFLVQFAVNLIIVNSQNYRWLKWLPVILFGAWLAVSFLAPSTMRQAVPQFPDDRTLCAYCHAGTNIAANPLGEWHPTVAIAGVWARYMLYFPGLLLTMMALLRQASVFDRMRLPMIAKDTRWAALAFGINSVFAGLIVSPAPYFPANILNYNSFLGTVGVPPQVFRAIMALITAYFVVRILHVFEIEYRSQLDKARQERFQGQIEALRELNRLKSEFISNVSHELRTPLNSIIGFSELLIDQVYGNLNEKQVRHVNNINVSGKHLLQIVNDILDLSKVEAGRMDLHVEEFPIHEVLESAAHTAQNLASGRALYVELKVDGGLSTIKADLRMFNQIMLNLLSNAVKFTPDGGKITIEAYRQDGEAAVAVADTGIGIDKKDHERIFMEFQQVESSLSRNYSGTGLGLALTKKFVEMHGGRIWVESNLGQGSVFRFTIPTRN